VQKLGRAVGLPIALFSFFCCRAPPGSSRCAAGTRHHQRLARARVVRDKGERGNFPLILQCRQAAHRFRAQARPSAVSGHHPRTTQMSLGGGECRVGGPPRVMTIIAGPAPNPRRRPIATNKPSTLAAADHLHCHTERRTSCWRRRAPRRSISHARRCLRARAPLSERCHESPLTAVVETGLLSRATR
jgi:hypothetical protein